MSSKFRSKKSPWYAVNFAFSQIEELHPNTIFQTDGAPLHWGLKMRNIFWMKNFTCVWLKELVQYCRHVYVQTEHILTYFYRNTLKHFYLFPMNWTFKLQRILILLFLQFFTECCYKSHRLYVFCATNGLSIKFAEWKALQK